MKTDEELVKEAEAMRRHQERVLAVTQEGFQANREDNLTRKIAHLRAHGMAAQANLLTQDLVEWRKR